MLDYFLFSFSIVFPLFGLCIIGFFLRRADILDDAFCTKGNLFCFKLAIPCLLFTNTYSGSVEQINPSLMLYVAGLQVSIIVIFGLIIPIFFKNNATRGAIIQAIFRSNSALFGLPLAISLAGEPAAMTISIILAVYVPMCNFLAVILLEIFKPKEEQKGIDFRNMLKSIVTNPMIISTAIALVFLFSGVHLPQPLYDLTASVAKIATPLALIILGATFNLQKAAGNAVQLGTICLGRLVIVPAAILALSIYMGCWTNIEIISLLTTFFGPVAVVSYAQAIISHSDGELAGQAVVMTTLVSMVTVTLFIVLIQMLHLI